MRNINKKSKYNISNYVIIIIASLIISISFISVLSESINTVDKKNNLKVIIGYAFKLNNDPVSGGTVSISSINSTRTGIVLYDGSWQVDISGHDPGEPDWLDGTSFTVTITLNDLIGIKTGIVSGSISDVGIIWLDSVSNQPMIKNVKGGLRISATIAAGNTDCDWIINVDASFMLLGGEGGGKIEANSQETVKLPLTLAFGNSDIIVSANEIKKMYSAYALGPLFLNLQEI